MNFKDTLKNVAIKIMLKDQSVLKSKALLSKEICVLKVIKKLNY